jgi:ABC-type sugar transport system ATPase subunit
VNARCSSQLRYPQLFPAPGSRPKHLFFADKGMAGEVLVLEPLGLSTQITLEGTGERLALLTLDRPALAPGDPVRLSIAPANVHMFEKETGKAIRANRPMPIQAH